MKPLDRPLSEVLFITQFRDFCRSKGDERYNYGIPSQCALAQFEKARGSWCGPRAGGRDIDCLAAGLTASLYRSAWERDGRETAAQYFNFSALAQRLDALLPASVERVRG